MLNILRGKAQNDDFWVFFGATFSRFIPKSVIIKLLITIKLKRGDEYVNLN